jgi:NADH:ubiquinone oxidoreductase subunit C
MGLILSYKEYYLNLFFTFYRKILLSVITGENNIFLLLNKKELYGFVHSIQSNSLLHFRILGDICIIDRAERDDRFEIVYNLLSVHTSIRIFIKTKTNSYIDSISPIFRSAN